MKKNIFVTLSCFIATCLEMYDFVIFGLLANVINKNYLSFLNETAGLMVAYLFFAIGFIFRPLGSMFFGYIGDTYGRKVALVTSVSMMGGASLLMFLLPSYETIGVFSCFLIVLVRVVQGVSVGGEYTGSTIYAIEYVKNNKNGFIGSIVMAGSSLGIVLATMVSRLLQHPSMPNYAWRFAFLLGFGLSIVGYFIRKNLKETPEFKKISKIKKSNKPLSEGVFLFKKEFIASILMAGSNGATFYYYMVFAPKYLKTVNANLSNMGLVMIFSVFLLLPIVGKVTDVLGRIKTLLLATSINIIYSLFFLKLMLLFSNQLAVLFILVLIGSFLVSLMVVTVNVLVLEIFPVYCRFSCAGVGYNIGMALLGGTIPMVCSFIMNNTDFPVVLIGCYISFTAFIGFLSYVLLNKKITLTSSVGSSLNTNIIDYQKT